MSKEECNFKHKGKCFKTNIAKRNYIQTDESLKKAIKNKEPKEAIKLLRKFKKGWEGL